MSAVAVASADTRRRSLLVPGVAAFVVFSVLIGLGVWQLERLGWKEGLIAAIEARAHGEAGALPSEAEWSRWNAADDEFRRVRIAGTWLPDRVVALHGLAELRAGGATLGYYLFEPLRLPGGAILIVNRGFVPAEKRDETLAAVRAEPVDATLTGLERAPEAPGWFVPANDPGRGEWFTRDIGAMASAWGLGRVAPFYLDADRLPGEGWPRGGQTPLTLRNPHLGYALTWFGLAASLVGVFAAFVLSRARSGRADAGSRLGEPERGPAAR